MGRIYYQIGKAYRVSNKEGQVFKLAVDLSLTELKKLLSENKDVANAVKKIKTARHEEESFIELSLTPLSPEFCNKKKQFILEIQIGNEKQPVS